MEDLNQENSEKIPNVQEEADSKLFNKIKQINTPIKNELLITLLDGEWHPESELIRTAKKERKYAGAVLVGTMLNNINSLGQDVLLSKKIIDGEWHFKISNNYVGLTRAAFTRTAYRKLDKND